MKKILFLLFIFISISGCEYFTLMSKKEWEEKSGNEDNVIIYVSGEYDVDAFTVAPCYWIIKDGNIERFDLEGYINNTINYANSIYVEGETIYICGSCNNGTNDQACYWIKTKKYDLKVDPFFASQAYSITVKNGVVFIAGSENVNGCYWMNNNKIILVNSFAVASIFVKQLSSSKPVLYISGQDTNFQACWFKDGKKINLPNDGANLSGAYSIYADNYEIYLAGIIQDGGGNNYACLWKNNNLSYLPDGQYAYSLFVFDNDTYVAGQSGTGLACYWKNMEINSLSSSASVSRSIFVYNDIVYNAGQDQSWACLWINDKSIRLDNASSMAYSIFVKPETKK